MRGEAIHRRRGAHPDHANDGYRDNYMVKGGVAELVATAGASVFAGMTGAGATPCGSSISLSMSSSCAGWASIAESPRQRAGYARAAAEEVLWRLQVLGGYARRNLTL